MTRVPLRDRASSIKKKVRLRFSKTSYEIKTKSLTYEIVKKKTKTMLKRNNPKFDISKDVANNGKTLISTVRSSPVNRSRTGNVLREEVRAPAGKALSP